jgi:hypothetical protein
LDSEIVLRRRENKQLNRSLISFYQYLLKTGYDFRSTGIAWLIKKLHEQNEKVFEKHLPDHLDTKAKEFLMIVLLRKKNFNILNFNRKQIS